MPVVDESIEIDVPPEELWEIATRPETVRLTSSNLVEYGRMHRSDEGPPEVGDEVRGVTRVAGRSLEWTARISTVEAGKSIGFESLDAAIPFAIHNQFEDVGGGHTRVTFHQEIGEFGGFFGKLADAVVTRMYTKNVQSNLAALKEYAEAQ